MGPTIFSFAWLKIFQIRNSMVYRKERGHWYETDLVHAPVGSLVDIVNCLSHILSAFLLKRAAFFSGSGICLIGLR